MSAGNSSRDPLLRPDVSKMVHGYRMRRHQHRSNPFRHRNLPGLAPKDFGKIVKQAVPSVLLHSFTRRTGSEDEADEESLDETVEDDARPPAATPIRQTPTPILPMSSRSKIVQALLKDHYQHSRRKMERTLSPRSDSLDHALDNYRRTITRSLMPYLIEKAENDPRLPQLLHDEWLRLSTKRKQKADQITSKGTYVNLQRSRELENQERVVPEEVVAARKQEVRKMLKSPSERMQNAQRINKKGTYQNLKRARELLKQRKLVPKEVVTARNQQVKRMLEVGENYGQLKESSYKFQAPLTSDFAATEEDFREKERDKVLLQAAASGVRSHKKIQQYLNESLTRDKALTYARQANIKVLFIMPPLMPGDDAPPEAETLSKRLDRDLMLLCCYRHVMLSEKNYSKEVILANLKDVVQKMFKNIYLIKTFYHSRWYKEDLVLRNNFTRQIMTHLENGLNSDSFYIDDCTSSLKKMFEDYANYSPPPNKTRPPSGIPRRSRIPGRQENSIAKVNETVQNMESQKEDERKSEENLKRKLDRFSSNICKIFIEAQKKKFNNIVDWSQAFRDHLDDILMDLSQYFRKLPFSSSKSFNRRQVQFEFNQILKQLYTASRSEDVSFDGCCATVKNALLVKKELMKIIDLVKGLKSLVDSVIEVRETSKLPARKTWNLNPTSLEKILPSDIARSSNQTRTPTPRRFDKNIPTEKNPPTNATRSARTATPGKSIRDISSRALQDLNVQSEIHAVHPDVQTGLLRIMDLWTKIRESFCRILSNPDGVVALDLENQIYAKLRELKDEFLEVLYGGNDDRFAAEIQAIDNDFVNLGIHRFFQKLHGQKIATVDCDAIINERFDESSLPADDVRHDLTAFLRRLGDFQSKYLMKIVSGEAQGHLQPRVYVARPASNKSTRRVLVDSPLDSSDAETTPKIVTPKHKSPAVNASKLHATSIEAARPKAGSSKSRVNRSRRVAEPVGPAKIKPFRYEPGMEVPDDVVEYDILYVGCQLIDRFADDWPIPNDRLSRGVIEIATKFKNRTYTRKASIGALSHILLALPCIPIYFFNTFVFHVNNEFFSEIAFDDPALNAQIRAEMLNVMDKARCSDGTDNRLDDNYAMGSLRNFLSLYDDRIDEIAFILQYPTTRKSKFTMKQLMGDVSIAGCELSNAGNDLLAVPTSINGVLPSGMGAASEELFHLLNGPIPQGNVANETIREDMTQLDGRLIKQSHEVDHLQKSRIYKLNLRFVLQPTALNRQTFWQSRGSELPKWFPGCYTVFKDSFKLKPALQSSPSSVFLHAWRTMAPAREVEV